MVPAGSAMCLNNNYSPKPDSVISQPKSESPRTGRNPNRGIANEMEGVTRDASPLEIGVDHNRLLCRW